MGKESRGVVIDKDQKTSIGSLPVEQLKAGEVLVKVHSAPINPSDAMFLKGQYLNDKPRPCICGFEGSGVIAEIKGDGGKITVGQRVAVFARDGPLGTWGEYVIADAKSVFPLPPNLNFEEGACSVVNPLTATSFVHLSLRDGHKALVHSAAASQLGKMLVTASNQAGLIIICIVRKQDHVKELQEHGAKYVLDSSSSSYKEDLAKLFEELKPSVFFDSVAGKDGSQIIEALPKNSITYNYGALSGEGYTIGAMDLIFKGKTLTGFWLSNVLKDKEMATQVIASSFGNLATGAFKTTIAGKFPHDKFQDAIESYKKKMSGGKVIIQNPHFEESK